MNRSYPHFPSFSIIFHHFPSFSIMVHHFPSFSMIFHDFPSFSTGQHMVKTWSAWSYSYRGMVIPVIPVIPGCSVRSLRPRWCKSYRCDQQHPCWGPKWSTHRPIGISWDWPSRWLFYDMMSSVSGQWGILGVFFDVLEVLGDWEIPHLQIIDVFACFCHQGLHW